MSRRILTVTLSRRLTLLADPDAAAAMGQAGRDWVASKWRWDTIASRLSTLLSGE